MKKKPSAIKSQRLYIFIFLVMAVGVYVILPQFGSFKGSLRYIFDAQLPTVLLGLAASLFTYIAAAGIYYQLAIKPIGYFKTFIVQLGAMFINRILPAGIGAIGVSTAYLHRNKHTLTQSAAIVSLNNLIGMLGHGLLLLLAYVLWSDSISDNALAGSRTWVVAAVIVILVTSMLAVIFTNKTNHKVVNIRKQLAGMLSYYSGKPSKLVLALVFSMLLTLGNVACLWFSAYSIGADISFPAALIILTLGVSAATAIPTPGGLGTFEAAIYGGLVAFDVPQTQALAGAIMFRLLNYWIPLLIGLTALLYSQKRKWIVR